MRLISQLLICVCVYLIYIFQLWLPFRPAVTELKDAAQMERIRNEKSVCFFLVTSNDNAQLSEKLKVSCLNGRSVLKILFWIITWEWDLRPKLFTVNNTSHGPCMINLKLIVAWNTTTTTTSTRSSKKEFRWKF